MFIKGYLDEISFVELLRIIGKHNGKLGLWNFQETKQYECYFQDGNIVYININGKDILDSDLIVAFFYDISQDKKSYYSFHKDTLLHTKPQIKVSIQEILSKTISKNTKTEEPVEHLPNIQTKFEAVNGFSANLSGDIGKFWDFTAPYLQRGCCSAVEIADILGMDTKVVQMNFYKLRMIGAIKPIRLFTVPNISAKAKNVSSNLQKIVNMRNGEKLSLLTSNNNPPGVSTSVSTISPPLTQSNEVQPTNQEIFEVKKFSFDDVESDKKTHPSNNEDFFKKFRETSQNNQVNSTVNNVQTVISENQTTNDVTDSEAQKPYFDLSVVAERKGIVKRMLSSLFSRRSV